MACERRVITFCVTLMCVRAYVCIILILCNQSCNNTHVCCRAFWGLYLYFPDRGEHIFQSFTPAVQRRLSEERESHNQPINSARKAGMVSYGRKSALGATSEPGERKLRVALGTN